MTHVEQASDRSSKDVEAPTDVVRQTTAEALALAPDEHRVKILLVDDKPANLLGLESILDRLGQELIKAASGPEALRCLLDDDFALILLDVQMPGMDGLETAELIRGRPRSQRTPIIFLTAYDPSELQMFKGYSLGAVDYLHKPIVPEVLRSKAAVFVQLAQVTEQVKRQAELLRQKERNEHEQLLAEERQRWEIERLRAEAANEKRIGDELAASARRKDKFLAMLSHELRNPLASIVNALRLVQMKPDDASAVSVMHALVQRQVRHLGRLLDDLLDVARFDQGKIQLRLEQIELAEVVGRAVESARHVIEAQRHQLEVRLPDESIILSADPTRLEQILVNLLNNAAKYTEPGGNIWLSAAREQHQVVLSVRDTGIGMRPEMLKHAFDLFVQAEQALDRSQGGLGIGLTLVRRLVKLHGGSITASSAGLGRGSELVMRLPAEQESTRGPAGPSANTSGRS
jgi:signal transduction histidine kinase